MRIKNESKELYEVVRYALDRYVGIYPIGQGMTVGQVIAESGKGDAEADQLLRKISVMVLGGNLPGQVSRVKGFEFDCS